MQCMGSIKSWIKTVKMATSMGAFDDWLTEKLTALSPEFDTDVFVPYIISMFDADSPADETAESIEEILSQVLDEKECQAVSKEIVHHWSQHNGQAQASASSAVKKDAGDMLSEIMEQQSLATVKETKLTAEQRAHKQAILAQYAQVSDGNESDDGIDDSPPALKGKGDSTDSQMERNLNSAGVVEAQQAQREYSRQEHERKKEKDKQDREAQRQKKQERKEGEKRRTQKGERRR